MRVCVFNFFSLNFFLNFYLFLRDRDRAWAGEGQRAGRHRIGSRLQALRCQHRARHEARTYEPGDHDLSWSQELNRPSHPGAPQFLLDQHVGIRSKLSLLLGDLVTFQPFHPSDPSYPTLKELAGRRPDIPIYVGNTERPVFWNLNQSGVQLTNINIVPFGIWQQVRYLCFFLYFPVMLSGLNFRWGGHLKIKETIADFCLCIAFCKYHLYLS